MQVSKLALILLFSNFIVGCGGSKSGGSGGGTPPVDPSGNWVFTAKDASENFFNVSAMASQNGSVVMLAHIIADTSELDASCYPYAVNFSNGNVTGATFTGTFAVIAKTGATNTFNFTSTLAQDGLSVVSGTYAMASAVSFCFPAAVTGSFSGHQVPDVTGNWTGTIQPCDFNDQDGSCAVKDLPSTIALTMTQNDAAATVTGTYTVTNTPGLSSGTIATNGTFDFLSGHNAQLTWSDANGNKLTMAGGPNFSSSGFTQTRTFVGKVVSADQFWWLTIQH